MNINPFKTFRVLVTRYYESIRIKELHNITGLLQL